MYDEQAILKTFYELKDKKSNLTHFDTADALNRAGIKSSQGKTWTPGNVSSFLTRRGIRKVKFYEKKSKSSSVPDSFLDRSIKLKKIRKDKCSEVLILSQMIVDLNIEDKSKFALIKVIINNPNIIAI